MVATDFLHDLQVRKWLDGSSQLTVPAHRAAVLKHIQADMPYGVVVPTGDIPELAIRGRA